MISRFILISCLWFGLFSLAPPPGLASEDDLRRSRAALADGRYLTALYLAEQALLAGTNPPAAALVMARAADLGKAADRRTEQLYLNALEVSQNKARVLGYLSLFYLQRGQHEKAGQAEAAFIAVCRYQCAPFKQQIKAAKQNR